MAQSRTDIAFGDLGRGFQIGINNGPIHLPPERPETPPSPSSTVPFLRDPDYVDREALLERVHAKCSIPASRTALVGLGGVGKSQLAIQYSYQIRDRSPDTWVFWVHASNSARIEQSYRDIANRVRIPGREHRKWCLILDNVDDYRVFNATFPAGQEGQDRSKTDIPRQPLLTYLPQSQNGSILITTRSMEVTLRFVEQGDIVEVESMDLAHAVTLLEKKLGEQDDNKNVVELAAALEFMPLAIVQAAAYISQRAPRCSVQKYLEEFQKSDRKKTNLLNHEGGHLRRDWEATNSIITTWQISFEHIRQARPSAADLLSLMSFFDRQGIPETLVRSIDIEQHHENVGGFDALNDDADIDNSSESSRDDGFEDDILTLRNYSFISANTDQTTFEMHRLVQLAVRKWLGAHGQLERWKEQFIKNLVAEFPIGVLENWDKCQSLFPHARSAVAHEPDDKDSLREWASLLHKAALYAWARGNVVDAEKLSLKAMKTKGNLFGQEHEKTLRGKVMVGLAYNLAGRWKDAEELNVQVMETTKRLLGAEHPHTLTSVGNLASTYRNQGRWKEAEELEVQVMETIKRVRGAEHRDTLTSMNNLAATYRNQGRWKEAEELNVQVIEKRKRVLGAEHPHTLTSMANLAATYMNQGRWDEAEELNVQVMETTKRLLGAEHPHTLANMGNLASTYRNQGRWKEAEELDVHVMETTKRVLGAEHPVTLASIRNLAFTWKGQGRDSEAIQLMEECLQLRLRILGINHPDTFSSSAALSRWQAE